MALLKRSDFVDTSLRKSLPESKMIKAASAPMNSEFDIFLSHSFKDKDVVLSVARELEGFNLSVYIDWDIDRSKVNKLNAKRLRKRMEKSKALLFLVSDNASISKWMPWELGFMDGLNKRVAIVPMANQNTDVYTGQEYLGLYPYLSKQEDSNGNTQLWIENTPWYYNSLDAWIETGKLSYDKTYQEYCKKTMKKTDYLLALVSDVANSL